MSVWKSWKFGYLRRCGRKKETDAPRKSVGRHEREEGDYETREPERLIPSFSIRLRKVLGCISRIFAAPLGPSMTPSARSSAATM
jgi:hypothetical protein